jgi:hypothetical protein
MYCMYVCTLLALERINRFAPNLVCLFLETKTKTQEGQNSGINVLSSSPGDGGSCNSETKHDRSTAPRPKLIVLKRRLQELRSLTQKLFWVRVSVKMMFLGLIIIFL